MLIYGGEGLMNININFIHKCKDRLYSHLEDTNIFPEEWIIIAKMEKFDTMQDWIKKEIALCDFELERRKRELK